MKNKIILIIMILILMIPVVNATMPTQQSNKIYLNPFYQSSMAVNTNITFNVTVNPPDGITKVINAIITFNGQINGQTQTFTIWVNGVACNTPTYSVATAFSTTGNVQFSFDCSNRITKAGTYNVTLRSAVATGAMSGSLELTYMNNPIGDMSLSGTEYSPGDPATVFVQLTDSYDHAVQNGSCYLDIWWPANASNVHPYTIQDAPMLQALGDDGMYYYDLTAPSTLGVYMLSAKCNYAYNWNWIYEPNDAINFPTRTTTSGTWVGSSQSLNTRTDSLYERCTNAAATTCDSYYIFNTSIYGVLTNVSNINIYYSGQSDVASRTLTMSYWNGTAYVNLANVLTYSATGATATVAGPIDEYLTNTVPLAALMANGTIRIKLTTNTGLARFYNNWLTIAILSNAGTVQEVKGNSEMHITNIPNATTTQVWNATNRTLTYYAPASVDTNAVALAVWNYTTRNLTYYDMTDTTNYALLQTYVWNATNRNLTYYAPASIDTNAIALAVWNYTTRNLTYTPQVELTNYTLTQISNETWLYPARYTHGVILS